MNGDKPDEARVAHHNHHHHHGGAERALWIALALNGVFLVVEVGAGLWTNSLVLLSDAGHMLSDVGALALALITERLARQQPAGSYTFGLRRAPVLGAFGNALTLLAIVAVIFWEAWQRALAPPPVQGWPVLVVGVLGLAINLGSAWWLHRSGGASLNIRGALLHMLADALGSMAAIIAAVVIMFTGWARIDPLMSALIGLFILLATWPLLRDSIKVLLQAAPASIDMGQLRGLLSSQKAVACVCDLHVWELGSSQTMLSAHLMTTEHMLESLEQAADDLRQELQNQFGIEHATFEWRISHGPQAGCEHGQSVVP